MSEHTVGFFISRKSDFSTKPLIFCEVLLGLVSGVPSGCGGNVTFYIQESKVTLGPEAD